MSCAYPGKGTLIRPQDTVVSWTPVTQAMWSWAGSDSGFGRQAHRGGPCPLGASTRAAPEATNTKTMPTMVSTPPLPAIEVTAMDSN